MELSGIIQLVSSSTINMLYNPLCKHDHLIFNLFNLQVRLLLLRSVPKARSTQVNGPLVLLYFFSQVVQYLFNFIKSLSVCLDLHLVIMEFATHIWEGLLKVFVWRYFKIWMGCLVTIIGFLDASFSELWKRCMRYMVELKGICRFRLFVGVFTDYVSDNSAWRVLLWGWVLKYCFAGSLCG